MSKHKGQHTVAAYSRTNVKTPTPIVLYIG